LNPAKYKGNNTCQGNKIQHKQINSERSDNKKNEKSKIHQVLNHQISSERQKNIYNNTASISDISNGFTLAMKMSQSTQFLFKSRYFEIKSISEENIHKSIKYKIWCSTPKGNKKLNKAFKESNGIPIYLFFSVNGSGRFLGVAEITSELDLNANFNYWSQSKKWKGFFYLRWLIIKDVPNRAFNNIINEYNHFHNILGIMKINLYPPPEILKK